MLYYDIKQLTQSALDSIVKQNNDLINENDELLKKSILDTNLIKDLEKEIKELKSIKAKRRNEFSEYKEEYNIANVFYSKRLSDIKELKKEIKELKKEIQNMLTHINTKTYEI